MTKPHVYKRRRQEALEVFKEIKPSEYDQSQFCTIANCGTTACFAGWYAHKYPKRMPEFKYITREVYFKHAARLVRILETGDRLSLPYSFAKHWGISLEDTHQIIYGDDFPGTDAQKKAVKLRQVKEIFSRYDK